MRILLAAALALVAASPPKPITPPDIVARAPASAWRAIPPEDLLVLDLKSGARIVIQLAPAFAPIHVANIRALAHARWWDGAAIYRVQDNYVVQWGHNDDRTLPAGIVGKPPPSTNAPSPGWQ